MGRSGATVDHDALPPLQYRSLPGDQPQPSPVQVFAFVHVNSSQDASLHGQLRHHKTPPTSLASNPPTRQLPSSNSNHGRDPKRRPAEHDKSYERQRAGLAGALARYRRLRTKAEACESQDACGSGEAPPPPPLPKWYVLAFGSVRVPVEIDMKDIKSRLRRQSMVAPASPEGDGKVVISSDVAGGGGSRERRRRGWGGWKLIRSLTCTSGHLVAESTDTNAPHIL